LGIEKLPSVPDGIGRIYVASKLPKITFLLVVDTITPSQTPDS